MKQLILLAPPKILLQHSALDWLKHIGNNAIIYTCSSQREELEHHLGRAFELNFCPEFNDNPVVELDVYKRALTLKSPLVAALAEIDLERAARVNDRLGVTKNSAERVCFFRDKYKMKSLAKEKGALVPAMSKIHNSTELDRFAERHGFPFVVKPCDGRGSNGVKVFQNEDQLRSFLSKRSCTTFFNLMAEEFIEGTHYQVNGLVIGGKPVVISTSKALVSCLDFLAGTALGLQMMDPTSPISKKIRTYAEWLLFEVLPTEDTSLFHLEVFVMEDGDIILGEIASRLGGCFVNEELKAAWGIDLRMSYLSAIKNPNQVWKYSYEHINLVGQLLIPPKEGILLSAPETCDLDFVLTYKFSGAISKHYTRMSFTNGEIMSAIIKGSTENEVKDNLLSLNKWFQEHSKWTEPNIYNQQ
ncbi:MAG: acetyl-CoA carboxylase biotin carboxylase subunit family protein [Vibrio sp.]